MNQSSFTQHMTTLAAADKAREELHAPIYDVFATAKGLTKTRAAVWEFLVTKWLRLPGGVFARHGTITEMSHDEDKGTISVTTEVVYPQSDPDYSYSTFPACWLWDTDARLVGLNAEMDRLLSAKQAERAAAQTAQTDKERAEYLRLRAKFAAGQTTVDP